MRFGTVTFSKFREVDHLHYLPKTFRDGCIGGKSAGCLIANAIKQTNKQNLSLFDRHDTIYGSKQAYLADFRGFRSDKHHPKLACLYMFPSGPGNICREWNSWRSQLGNDSATYYT